MFVFLFAVESFDDYAKLQRYSLKILPSLECQRLNYFEWQNYNLICARFDPPIFRVNITNGAGLATYDQTKRNYVLAAVCSSVGNTTVNLNQNQSYLRPTTCYSVASLYNWLTLITKVNWI